jgi:hypothetical protein
MFELSAWDTLVYTLLVLALMFLLSKLLAEPAPAVRIRDNKNGHRWIYTGRSTQLINFPLHCNACETFLLTATGQCCSICGAASCANVKCVRTVDRKTSCKSVSRSKSLEEAEVKSSTPAKHKWLPGNLPLEVSMSCTAVMTKLTLLQSLCSVCEEPAGDGPGLRDLRCVWCQRKVHTACQHLLGVRQSFLTDRSPWYPGDLRPREAPKPDRASGEGGDQAREDGGRIQEEGDQ